MELPQSCCSNQRLILAPISVPNYNANYSESSSSSKELSKSIRLAIASQTLMMLPNLNQYLFFLSKFSRSSQSQSQCLSPKPGTNGEQSENKRRRKLEVESTNKVNNEMIQSSKPHQCSSAVDRFREAGAILRDISDRFDRTR